MTGCDQGQEGDVGADSMENPEKEENALEDVPRSDGVVGLIEVGLGLLPHGEGPGSSNEGTNEAESGCLHREGKDRGGRHLSVV